MRMKLGEYLIVYLVLTIALTFWTNRTLDFWVTYAKGVPTDAPVWVAFLVSMLSPIAFVGNLISEVVRLFV